MRRAPGIRVCANWKRAAGRPSSQRAARYRLACGLRAAVVLGDRAAGLDLVVDDLLDGFLGAEHRAAGLEVQVTLDRPLDLGREPELDSSLHRDRLAEPWHELLEGDGERLDAELERRVPVQALVPGDAELVVLGARAAASSWLRRSV